MDQNPKRSPDSAISEFLGVVAHRIHTPVATIKWQVEALLDSMMGELTEEQMKSLQRVMKSAESLNEFSRTMLYVYELEKDIPMQNPRSISLIELFRSVCDSLEDVQRSKVSHVALASEARVIAIMADPDIAFMILRTLIENALQYADQHSDVKVSATEEQGGITVTVVDHGMGISSDTFPSIGSKFFRTPEARRKFPDGAGLNLFIAMNLAERTGGKISFESEEGRGSRFHWFTPHGSHRRQPWQR